MAKQASHTGSVQREVTQICLHVFMISDAFENETAKKVKLQNILMQLRKCVNHPYLFDGE